MITAAKLPPKTEADQLASLFRKKYAEDELRFKALPGITTNWTPERLVVLFQLLAGATGASSQEKIAKIIGVDRSAISRKVNSLDWGDWGDQLRELCEMTQEEAIKNEAEDVAEVEVKKEQVKTRKRLITREAFYSNLQKQILEAAKSVRLHTSVPAAPKPPKKHISSPEHVVLLLSDLHTGLDFSKADTGGINAFNTKILEERTENLKRGIRSIWEIHRQAYALPEIHIFGLGDMVQGANLNGEWGPAYSSATNVTAQAGIAATTMAGIINHSLTMFNKVSFLGVIGNHGRGGVSKNSDKVGANWDNVSYMILEGLFSNNPRVSIKFDRDTWWSKKNVLGTQFMLVHGDGGYGGSSPNALQIANRKLQDLAYRQTGSGFNVLCVGHYHSHVEIETPTGAILVNGSFVGSDIHSLQHMRTGSRPTQTIMGVHPEHGLTWKYCIDLDRTQNNKRLLKLGVAE